MIVTTATRTTMIKTTTTIAIMHSENAAAMMTRRMAVGRSKDVRVLCNILIIITKNKNEY
jgi:hypothetical protein